MTCYEAIDLMGDALEGSLPAHARAGLDEHLDECPACRTYLEQLRMTRQALGHLPPSGDASRRRSDVIAAFRREFQKDG